ncbi:MAG TPA: DUF4169 family protein [Vineibacter sp.]|nr:DUF4169 family protein [Vineibacter sp.]
MADVVNLRQARKRKARLERERTAEANRLKFGRPKAETAHNRLEKARTDRAHEGHRRDDAPDE